MNDGRRTALLLVSIALTSTCFYFTGWLAEDAYINFRVVENIVSGNGPVWNLEERVQVFTSPLWVVTVSFFSFLLGTAPPVSALVVSLLCDLLVVAIVVHLGTGRPLVLGFVLTCLFCSQSFLDYSSSGLENPLLHALLAVLCLLLGREADLSGFRFLLGISLVSSLLLVTRHDSVFLAAPAAAYAFWKRHAELGWRRTAPTLFFGMLPFGIWELCSLAYYGSLIPNTALAKVPLGFSKVELARRGLTLIEASLAQDPGSVLSMVFCPLALYAVRSRFWVPSAAATVGTLLYVVAIGGDFMLGRFLSGIFVFSWLLLLVGTDKESVVALLSDGRSRRRYAFVILSLSVLAASLYGSYRQFSNHKFHLDYGPQPIYKRQVADERSFYSSSTGVRAMIRGGSHRWLTASLAFREGLAGRKALVALYNVGMAGYSLGPDVFIIDLLCLGNPFLSRLPATSTRAGEYFRQLPAGYLRTLTEGRNVIVDPTLARLFDDVALATRAPLLARGRLAAIARLNVGHYRDRSRLSAYLDTPGGVENAGLDKMPGLTASVIALSESSVQPPWSRTRFPSP